MDEALAITLVEKAGGQIYEYTGQESSLAGAKGHFEILEDLNCCAPTQNVLFAFVYGTKRKVMSAGQLIEFFENTKKAA